MSAVAIIGGSGCYTIPELQDAKKISVATPFGDLSEVITAGRLAGRKVFFLPRHGTAHSIAPHKINYRANIYALQQLGVNCVFAINAVGAINQNCEPGKIVIPQQIIDYTYGREHTFFDGDARCREFYQRVEHIEFAEPIAMGLFEQCVAQVRQLPEALAQTFNCQPLTYGCVQGPRLETAAEIRRMARDGCDMVGMTLMPEAALAKELNIDYVSLCISANWAAGLAKPVSFETMKGIVANRLVDALGLIARVISV